MPDRNIYISGLKWVNVGTTKPTGTALQHRQLEDALLKKSSQFLGFGKSGRKEMRKRMHDKVEVEFTDAEWEVIKNVPPMTLDQYVRSDATRHFVTAERFEFDRQQMLQSRQLCEAAREGDVRQCALLIEKRANVNYADKFQMAPLHIAAANGHVQICTMFIRQGANVNCRNLQGDTPLSKSAIRGCEPVVSLLLQAGAKIETRDSCGETPLFMASYNNHLGTVDLLLRHGADKDTQDFEGQTPLIMAASFGNMKIARLLLNVGADKEHKDKKDDSALEYALAANRDDMVALLDMDPEKRLKSGSAKERERTVAVIAAQAAYAPHKQRMAAKKKKVAMTVGKGQTARARPTGAGPPTRRGGAKGGTKAAKKVSVGFGR